MFLEKIVDAISGKDDGKKVKGTVVLMKKNVLDFTDINASVLDGVLEFLGRRVSLELISSVHVDPGSIGNSFSALSDRKPPGLVGRGNGRGRDESVAGRHAKGIWRGMEDAGAKGRGKGGPGAKSGGKGGGRGRG